jgi:hypothetical protein
MAEKFAIPLVVGLLAASLGDAGAPCDPTFTQALHASEQVVNSLHADKPGQARVFSSDGTEFTAGEAIWMRGQLKHASEACARGDQAEAARLLKEVQDLIKGHSQTR